MNRNYRERSLGVGSRQEVDRYVQQRSQLPDPRRSYSRVRQEDRRNALGAFLTKSVAAGVVFAGGVMALGHFLGGETDKRCNPLSDLFPEDVKKWKGIIERYACENGLDSDLIGAVILQESEGKPDAYSKSGAVGLMQVMPRDGRASHFMCPNGPCFADRPSTNELWDPAFNVSWGARILKGYVDASEGNVRKGLKLYGPMDVGYQYADIVLEHWRKYSHR